MRYADLIRDVDHPLVDGVVEQQNHALLYVIDHARLSGRHTASVGDLRRALAMRGDPAWLGVLRAGQLDIYATDLRPDPNAAPSPYPVSSGEAQAVLPRLAQGENLSPPSSLLLREVLLDLMKHAGEELRGHGLSTDETIALTGRALFFRYLIGRKIVTEGHLPNIAPSAPTLMECLSTAASLAETNRWLDLTFNGDLLSLPNQSYPTYFAKLMQTHGDKLTRPLRAIMGLDKSMGPGISQQRLDWGDLDFNHLPIGLLSETYEALIEHFDKNARRDTSVYYTPSHIAEYMVEAALHEHPAGAEARVLDPACGAGVFLVACFRKLAELRFKATGERPTREALRAILDKQLTGFDTNAHARTLAALALYLTALELDPDPTPVEALTFHKLEGRVLIDVADPGSDPAVIVPMAGSLGEHVSEAYRGAFDLVIGNPPWTSLKSKYAAIDKRFTAHCRAIAERRGLTDIAHGYKNPDKVPDLPFVWGAMEWAKPGGRIALALHGRWLFKMTDAGFAARRAIFQALAITGILNGASLQGSKVWPNMNQPFCLLFADNRVPGEDDEFVLVSPEWERELNGKGRMRIDALDAVPVNLGFASRQPAAIKTLYCGTVLDKDIVARVVTRAKHSIADFWSEKRGLYFNQGYQIASRAKDDTFLRGLPTLDALYSRHPFFVLDNVLESYRPKGLHRPRDPRIYKAPLLLVRKGSRADRARGRALVSTVDVAYSESYYGYSAAQHPDGDFLVRYLLVLVHSRLFEYLTLMSSGEFGIERRAFQLLDIGQFPLIHPEELDEEQRSAINTCAAQLLANRPDWPQLDRTVARLYGLSELDQQTIADTLATRAPFAAVKSHAGQAVTQQEAKTFRAHLETELGNVLAASGHRVAVSLLESTDRSLPWRFLGVSLNGRPIQPDLPARWIDAADDLAASRITLIDAHEPCLAVGLLDRYRYWTPTQARLLASDLLWQHGALLEERANQ
ncbi:HsdM family class I SAM-dependent methyltransferase [Thiorhodovibrio frisius]|uniref:HsdM family class I SAM-dependent methyltransferase n=1 Tax=Thiorhodovibrio frisius TaxID=631362 RepID=UPI001CBB399B|nr:N-6 DNA methylase [Thiorhodovibrio frisius]